MRSMIVVAFAVALAAGPAFAQIGGSTGTATSPGMGGAQSGMGGGNLAGGGVGAQQQGTRLPSETTTLGGETAMPERRRDGVSPSDPALAPPPGPADRSAAGGSAVGGSGVPGTATGSITPR
jgi:hypothetical protein